MPKVKPSELDHVPSTTGEESMLDQFVELTNPRVESILRMVKAMEAGEISVLTLRPDESYPSALEERTASEILDLYPNSIGMFTSGSTGKPRLHFQSLSSMLRSTRPDQKEQIWGLLYAPSRMAGLQVVLQAHASDALIVEPDEGSSSDSFIQECIDNNVNSLSATPSRWKSLLSSEKFIKLQLKSISIGGEIADQNILDKLKTSFPSAKIRHIYATTETGPVFSVSDGLEGFPIEYLSRPLASGKTLEIVNGELVVSFESGKRKGETIKIQTGDLVEIQGDRALFSGRIGDIVNIGGVKVSLTEIERLGNAIPGVVDCQARQVPSAFMGSLVALDIQWEGQPLDNREVRSYFLKSLPKAAVPAVINQVAKLNLSENYKKRRTI